MSAAVDQNQMYFDLAHALALIVFARCVADDGADPCYSHFNENRLGIPPDILARLGVMRGLNPDQFMVSGSHAFINDWRPESPLRLARHPGEPSFFDLIVAVGLMVDWDQDSVGQIAHASGVPVNPPAAPDLKDHRRFRSETRLAFSAFAWRKAVACLEVLGLAGRTEAGRYALIPALGGSTPIALADSYQTTRHLAAQRLGGVRCLFPPT